MIPLAPKRRLTREHAVCKHHTMTAPGSKERQVPRGRKINPGSSVLNVQAVGVWRVSDALAHINSRKNRIWTDYGASTNLLVHIPFYCLPRFYTHKISAVVPWCVICQLVLSTSQQLASRRIKLFVPGRVITNTPFLFLEVWTDDKQLKIS